MYNHSHTYVQSSFKALLIDVSKQQNQAVVAGVLKLLRDNADVVAALFVATCMTRDDDAKTQQHRSQPDG